MATVQINARVDPALKKAIDDYCRSQGIVLNHFDRVILGDPLRPLRQADGGADIVLSRQIPNLNRWGVLGRHKCLIRHPSIANAVDPEDPLSSCRSTKRR